MLSQFEILLDELRNEHERELAALRQQFQHQHETQSSPPEERSGNRAPLFREGVKRFIDLSRVGVTNRVKVVPLEQKDMCSQESLETGLHRTELPSHRLSIHDPPPPTQMPASLPGQPANEVPGPLPAELASYASKGATAHPNPPMLNRESLDKPVGRMRFDWVIQGSKTQSLPSFEASVPARWRQTLAQIKLSDGMAKFAGRQRGKRHEAGMGIIILLNATFIGWQVQHAAHGGRSAIDLIGGMLFMVLFSADLLYRIFNERWYFCLGPDWRGNMFDTVVVLAMIPEQVLRLASVPASSLSRLSILRTIRLLRLVRLLRVSRAFLLFREFCVIVRSLQQGVRVFAQTLLVGVVFLYICAVVLTEGTLEICAGSRVGHWGSTRLCHSFGTVDRSFLSLFQTLYGGVIWGELLSSMGDLDVIYPIIFIFFVSFAAIVACNVITGIFLDVQGSVSQRFKKATLASDRIREKLDVVREFEKLFNELDVNKSGDLSMNDFERAFDDPELEGLLASLDLDVYDAKSLFEMLDLDQSGAIPLQEFVWGCIKLKGGAKAVEMFKLQSECAAIRKALGELRQSLTDCGPRSQTSVAVMPLLSSSSNDQSQALSDLGPRSQPTGAEASLSRDRRSLGKLLSTTGCVIEHAENRAMSLKELHALRREITRRCRPEGWIDDYGRPLEPEDVNLYHLNANHICPLTLPEGVVLQGLSGHKFETGDAVFQIDERIPGATPIAEGRVSEVSFGGVRIAPTRGRFLGHDPDRLLHIRVRDMDCGVATSAVSQRSISYKEAVSSGPLTPRWFCCHWWGERVFDFVSCCSAHAKLRSLSPEEASFWVCAYANRQHDLTVDITSDPECSSFRRAMRVSKGLLLVLDSQATPFRRIWCDFELYKTISVDKKPLDIVTLHEGIPRLLSQDTVEDETPYYKSLREQQFPIHCLMEGMRRRLEDGEASVEHDRRQILSSMACDVPHTADPDEALRIALRRANSALHAYFAIAAWPLAVKSGLVEDFDVESPGTLSLPALLREDEGRERLALSLAHSRTLHDGDVCALARGLPPNLLELRLSFDNCVNLTDAGVRLLVEKLPPALRVLWLDFSNCHEVTNAGVHFLARAFPTQLRELVLHCANCPNVGDASAMDLARSLPAGVTSLHVGLRGTQVNRAFESVDALRAAVKPRKRLLASLR